MAELTYDTPQTLEALLPQLQALPRGATVLMLGGMDSGKTTFVRDAVQALTSIGRSVAIVDCDLGQSEIGPPTTVGVAFAAPNAEFRHLRDLPVEAAYFIGSISPVRHTLDVCVGAVQMARVGKKRRPDLVFVDTDGFVQGAVACQFKRRLCELLLPQVVIALTNSTELVPILVTWTRLQTPELWRIPICRSVQRKTTVTRATRRAARFLAALAWSQPLLFSWDEVSLLGTSLGTGEPLPHHLIQFLSQSLGCRTLYAERNASGLFVIVQGERWETNALASIESYFRIHSVTIAAAQKFAGLLVGLVSARGVFLGLGRVEQIDFPRRTITVQTPCRKAAAVAQLWLGSLRLSPEGRELGELRPGEI
jgi:polynucleotide 5'-hydroxyl-kinase GRC3/NOL9